MIEEPQKDMGSKVDNPLKGKTSYGWHFEQNVFSEDSITRAIKSSEGSGNVPKVMTIEPTMLTTQRTEQAKQLRRVNGDIGVKFAGSKEYTIRQDDMSNTITTVEKDNLLVEPTIQRIGNIYPSKGQGEVVVNPKGIAPTVCECHGEVTRVVIQKVGDRGTDNYSVHDYANTVSANPMSDRSQMLVEPRVVSVGNRNPSGHGIGGEVYASEGLSPTLCVNKGSGYTISESESLTQKSQNMEQKPMYRIRKLTPVETGRLMGMDDADIHKMLDPKDDKGKPIISKSQAYKLHGNSIVVDVLYHIFRTMFIDTESTQPQQLTLF